MVSMKMRCLELSLMAAGAAASIHTELCISLSVLLEAGQGRGDSGGLFMAL